MNMYRITFKSGEQMTLESSSLFGVFETIRSNNVRDPRRHPRTLDEIATVVAYQPETRALVKPSAEKISVFA